MILLIFYCFRVIFMLVYCVLLHETKTKEMCESMPKEKKKKKSLKMDADSEASQQGVPNSLQRKLSDLEVQVYSPRILL